jgi:hypothetical protein
MGGPVLAVVVEAGIGRFYKKTEEVGSACVFAQIPEPLGPLPWPEPLSLAWLQAPPGLALTAPALALTAPCFGSNRPLLWL